jgi:hypothetical protein
MRASTLFVCLLIIGCGPSTGNQDPPIDAHEGGSGVDSAVVPVDESCKHIDVVIAIDNSASMAAEKAAMRDIAFPGFATALKNVGGGIQDFRVGVLDACKTPASFHTWGAAGACFFAGGKPWMDSTSANLVNEFKCVGDVDSSDMMCTGDNDDEEPITSAYTAFGFEFAGPGKPNDGFLRNNALLVVIAITDEDEHPVTPATAQDIYDRLVAVKGDVNKMVFLGIGGSMVCDGLYGHARDAQLLRDVTQKFADQGRGVFWDLCQGDLQTGLTQALTTITKACEDFGPIL